MSDWMRDLQQVRPVAGQPEPLNRFWLAAKTQPTDWNLMGQLHRDDAHLDSNSKALMRVKNPGPGAAEAGRLAVSKAMVEDPMLRAMREFERAMAEDSVRNRYELHSQIHEWFEKEAPQTRAVPVLNEMVYANLFLMPSSDPWLGLRPANAYSGLEGDGATVAAAALGQ